MKKIKNYFTRDIISCLLLLAVVALYIFEVVYPYQSTMSAKQLFIHSCFILHTFLIVRFISSGLLSKEVAFGIWLLGADIILILLMIIDTPREKHPLYYVGILVLLYLAADVTITNIRDLKRFFRTNTEATEKEIRSETELKNNNNEN